jgi:ABC-type transport system involved in cytochrome c biogenesis ATPase subunit
VGANDRVIEASGLRKEFTITHKVGILRRARRRITAVDGIDLSVERGEMLGYLGPNGAGKSTTLKMLTGVLMPSGGEVRVCGLVPVSQRRRLAARIGVVFGQRSQLWWDLPLRESFDLARHIWRVPGTAHAARLARLRAELDLDPFLDTPVRQLSLGQRMRGELCTTNVTPRRLQRLLHAPGQAYVWRLLSGAAVEACGAVVADADGLLTIPGIRITKLPRRLVVERVECATLSATRHCLSSDEHQRVGVQIDVGMEHAGRAYVVRAAVAQAGPAATIALPATVGSGSPTILLGLFALAMVTLMETMSFRSKSTHRVVALMRSTIKGIGCVGSSEISQADAK